MAHEDSFNLMAARMGVPQSTLIHFIARGKKDRHTERLCQLRRTVDLGIDRYSGCFR